MIEFKKYSSIENHFYKDYLDQVREQVPADMQWVVQEKVHGTNTSFLCDGNDVKFAKRTSILEDDEKFYDYQELVDELEKPCARDPRSPVPLTLAVQNSLTL